MYVCGCFLFSFFSPVLGMNISMECDLPERSALKIRSYIKCKYKRQDDDEMDFRNDGSDDQTRDVCG